MTNTNPEAMKPEAMTLHGACLSRRSSIACRTRCATGLPVLWESPFKDRNCSLVRFNKNLGKVTPPFVYTCIYQTGKIYRKCNLAVSVSRRPERGVHGAGAGILDLRDIAFFQEFLPVDRSPALVTVTHDLKEQLPTGIGLVQGEGVVLDLDPVQTTFVIHDCLLLMSPLVAVTFYNQSLKESTTTILQDEHEVPWVTLTTADAYCVKGNSRSLCVEVPAR